MLLSNNSRAPYFDASQLGSNAKTISSAFPFTQTEDGEVTYYEFDSTNAKDNVYFTWNNNTPTAVNYGAGTAYGVKDGIDYFMNPAEGQHSGYGIFPFNNTTATANVGTRYIYASSSAWGSNIYAYFYDSNNNPVGNAWPGTKMSTYGDGNNVRIVLPAGATGLVLNNGSDAQSQDITDLSWGAYWMDGNTAKNWDQRPSDAGAYSENLNYGFGINMDVKFRVPKGGRALDSSGVSQDIQFNFSGDDDLWMYITDETDSTKSPGLVLDMGGAHKQSTGNVKFLNNKITSVVDDVYGVGKVTKTFDFDYTHTYAMHIFYMERGMLESNCHMSFTMVPLGNNFIVNERINTTNVNPGLIDDVTALKSFNFTPSQNGSTSWENGLSYKLATASGEETHNKSGQNSVSLASGESFYVPNFFTINDKLGVTQTRGESVLKYNTAYTFKNNTTGQTINSGTASFEGADASVSAGEGYLSNTGTGGGDRFEFAELEASFVNTPVVNTASVTKKAVDALGNPLASSDLYGNDTFTVTAKVNIYGDGKAEHFKTYNLSYDTTAKSSYTEAQLAALPVASNGQFTIRNGQTVYFPGLPENAQIMFEESGVNPAHFDEESYSADYITVGEQANIEITNPRVLPNPVNKDIAVDKTIVTKTHSDANGANLKDGYKFELYYDGTKLDECTITSDSAADSAMFKTLTFTADESEVNESNGVFYVPLSEAADTGKAFTFTIKEALTADQKKVIDQPADQTVTVTVFYDKVRNTLTLDPSEDATSYQEFENPYKVGDVNVTKTVVDAHGSAPAAGSEDARKEFAATVTFTFNGNTYAEGVPFYYYIDGTLQAERLGSSQRITLKHGRTVSFRGLPIGTKVKVTEVADPEYAVSYQPQEVTVSEADQTFTIAVTNTRQQPGAASLAIKKVLANADVAAKTGKTLADFGFKFKLTETTSGAAYSEEVTATSEVVNFAPISYEHAGTHTYTITEIAGNDAQIAYDDAQYNVTVVVSQTASGLKVTKITYTDASGATVYETTDSAVSVDDAFKATFTNTYKTGSVAFSKRVLDATADDAEDTDAYTVKVEMQYPGETGYTAKAFDYTVGSDAKRSADGTLTVAAGDTVVIGKLPNGTKVKVTETDSKGCLYYYVNGQEMTAATDAHPAEIINQKVSLPVNIQAQKRTEGFDLAAGDFNFSLQGGTVDQTKSNAANGTVTFDTLTYEVRSDSKASSGNTIVLKPSDFVDNVYTDEFTISEIIPGNNAHIAYDSNTYKAVVTITATPSNDVAGLCAYSASVSYTKADGSALTSAPAFVNSWKTGSVKLVKSVLDYDGAAYDTDLAFDINVSFTYPAGYTGEKVPNGVYSLSKRNSFTQTISNLPLGTVVSIEEAAASQRGMTVTYSAKTATVAENATDNTITLTVTNKRQAPGETTFPVQFTKTMVGYDLADKEFSFTLNGEGFAADTTKQNDAHGLVDFGTVTVRYAKTATAADTENHIVYLTDADFNADGEATLVYTAAEVSANDASIIYDQAQLRRTVTITKTTADAQTTLACTDVTDTRIEGGEPVEQEAVFVNRKVGPVSVTKVTKQIDESGATVAYDTDQTFTATVTFKLPTSDSFEKLPFNYTMSDQAGVFRLENGQITLKNNRTITFPGLPYGTRMHVVEDKNSNYTTSYSARSAQVGGSVAEITVTNTLQQSGQVVLPVTKEFTENALKANINAASANGGKGNQFAFRMVGDSSNPVAALAAYDETIVLDQYDESGKLVSTGSFPAIKFPADFTYSADGTPFRFVVSEKPVASNEDGILTDTAAYEVIYTVKQTADGLDISEPQIKHFRYDAENDTYVDGQTANTVTFTNDFEVGSISVIKVVKDFDGADMTDAASTTFSADVTMQYPNGDPFTDHITVSARQGKTYTDVPLGTKVYVVETDAKGMSAAVSATEQNPAVVTKDTSAVTVTITNTRVELNPDSVEIEALKEVIGAENLAKYAGQFNFELTGEALGSTKLTATNDANGKITFAPITFRMRKNADDTAEANTILVNKSDFADGDKLFTFTVKEIKDDSRKDIAFDTAEKTVTVKVSDTTSLTAHTLSAVQVVDESNPKPVISNTQLGRAKLTKTALDIDSSSIKPDADFTFKAEANGSVISDNIIINLSKPETSTYTTPYLPVGTVVTFTETDKAGFENTDDVKTVTVIDESDSGEPAAVAFVNRRPQPGVITANLSALKQADGFKLSDGDFNFTAKGRGIDETKTNTAAGTISFSEITYKYTKGDETDDGNTVYLHDADFTDNKAVLSYTIQENAGSNTDLIYATNTVNATVTITKTETASTITLSAEVAYPDGRTFTNPLRKGSATIIKRDQNDNPVDGVTFSLFKVSGNNLSREEVLANGSLVDSRTTQDGIAKFENLSLYVNDSQTIASPERQWYCFAETDAGDSYNLNSKLTFFQLPQENVYDVEYTYMNGEITTPTSGGSGMFAFKLIGSVLVFMASLALAGYIFFVKAPKTKNARHSAK